MQIAFVLYDRFTALDIVGPFQTLAEIPGIEPVFVAERAGPVRDHTGRIAWRRRSAASPRVSAALLAPRFVQAAWRMRISAIGSPDR